MYKKAKNYLGMFQKKILLLVTCLIVFIANTTAGGGGIEEKITGIPMTGTVNQTAPTVTNALAVNTVSVTDYYNSGLIIPTTQQSKTIKNIISFGLVEESNKFLNQDFTATVELKIEYGHDASSLSVLNQTFTIDYKKADAAKYNSLQYFTLNDAEYVKITLVSITAPTVGPLDTREVLIIKNEMQITRFVELPAVVPAPTLFNAIAPPDPIPDHLTVNWVWPVNTGNNATQLEWVWVETETESEYYTGGAVNTDLVFNNSTRVDLSYGKINYDVPLLYDGAGKLYYRIRAVNVKENGNRSDGPWNVGSPHPFNGHNAPLNNGVFLNKSNWQSTTSFAEDGKRKTVVQYFDGSLRSRQTVTKDNTTNTVVTAESFYDAQGRPAIQILPTPILPTPGISNIIAYQANLNLFNGQTINQDPAEIFDMQPVATPNSFTPGLQTSSGTSNYYSPSNAATNAGANKNIPDAEGYPYTVTRYTPDATGRVLAQSGVGFAHRMGSKHETKYYYGGAAQEELDGLFGTEVGFFSHYSKNMVKDANGQMSISYTDMHGRTIATALAGDEPPALQALDKNNPASYPNQAGTLITRNLLDNTTNNVKGTSIESINSLLVPAQTNYEFKYELNPETLQLPACAGNTPATLCYDCLYDLEIAITDESGETEPIIRKISNVSLTPDDNCNTPIPPYVDLTPTLPTTIIGNAISFTASLPMGSYSVRKTLTINEASLQKYKGLYMSKALCKTEQELIDSIYNVLLNTSNCGNTVPITCGNCLTNLGPEPAYRINYLSSIGNPVPTPQIESDIHLAYVAALQNCNSLCTNVSQSVATIREMMLSDMIPFSGQYASEDATDYTSAGSSQTMYNKYNIFSNIGLPRQPYYKYPWKLSGSQRDYYLDDVNNIDITIHPPIEPPVTLTLYDFLDVATKPSFEQLFKPSWANSLLPHHPEYQRLLFAESTAMVPSYNWINSFTQTDDILTSPQANAYLNPAANDPFFTEAPSYLPLMNAAVNNYEGMGVGMWQLAYGDVMCKNIINVSQRQSCYQTAPNSAPPYGGFTAAENEQAWQVFRGLYAAKRNSFVDEYIATSRPLANNEENDLIAQHYSLWFPRNASQTAAQNQWSWWQTTPGGGPTGTGTGGGTPTPPTNQCSSYINMWRNQLLQCEALANSADKDVILTAITTRMQAVCANGMGASNTYGSSNVAPSTPASVTDRSFEDVIKNVFIQYNIINGSGIYTDNYCNPYVIEWPKPYGLGPKMVAGEMTGQVDSCNCKAFAKVKAEAVALNYNPGVLASLNLYLQSQYGETLTQGMFDGLQHCDELVNVNCSPKDTILTYNCADPAPPCPGEYPKISNANRSGAPTTCGTFNLIIQGFISEYGLNPENCRAIFTEYFNGQCSLNYTWEQITSLYEKLCDKRLPICNDIAFNCDELQGVINLYYEQQQQFGIPCQSLFTTFFNNHFGTQYTWGQIVAIYLFYCNITLDVCGSGPVYECEELQGIINEYYNIYGYGQEQIPCQDLFTDLFNQHYGTSYTWEEIVAIYLNTCEITLNICSPLCQKTCTVIVCDTTYQVYILPQPQPLPDFLKCGYTSSSRCVSCVQLSNYTAEYKIKFAPAPNTAPIFTGTNLSPAEVQHNMNYARFINYRTGFQYDWLQYSQAASAAAPACNLA
ncbi:MAG: hypothetical protein H7320_00170, partial [Ferruginibacter sp.]|nr:hypothetical protein [Ferruginibacter sp.]